MWPTVAVVVVLGVAHIAARYTGRRALAGILKPLPILLLAVLVGLEGTRVAPAYRGLLVAGLLCSMAGDIWLVFPDRFVAGLASFLIAHVLYIAAFAPRAPTGRMAGLTLLPFLVFGALVLAYLWPHLGRDRAPVIVYMSVIVMMGWCAALRAPEVPAPSGVLALAGALLFMTSDALLAVDRFARHFAAADGAVMTTYYAAQTLIALSAVA